MDSSIYSSSIFASLLICYFLFVDSTIMVIIDGLYWQSLYFFSILPEVMSITHFVNYVLQLPEIIHH
jgi:hypothetical protein